MVLPRTGQGKIIGWFLPLYSVPRVMKHMLACKAEGTLIVPRWSSSPYWPMIFRQNLVYQDYITDFIDFSNPEKIFVQGSNKNSFFGSNRFTAPVLALRIKALMFCLLGSMVLVPEWYCSRRGYCEIAAGS